MAMGNGRQAGRQVHVRLLSDKGKTPDYNVTRYGFSWMYLGDRERWVGDRKMGRGNTESCRGKDKRAMGEEDR